MDYITFCAMRWASYCGLFYSVLYGQIGPVRHQWFTLVFHFTYMADLCIAWQIPPVRDTGPLRSQGRGRCSFWTASWCPVHCSFHASTRTSSPRTTSPRGPRLKFWVSWTALSCASVRQKSAVMLKARLASCWIKSKLSDQFLAECNTNSLRSIQMALPC